MNALVAEEEDNICDVVCFVLCHERVANFVYSLRYWQAIKIEATTVFNFRNVQREVTLNRHIR